MQLNTQGLKDRQAWEEAGYELPLFDREEMLRRTWEEPFWVHFGAGNIFRAYQAHAVQRLLNEGALDRGIVVAEGFDDEIIRAVYAPHDNLTILATLRSDGTVAKTVIGSIAEALAANADRPEDFERLRRIFAGDSLQLASFTITEKGYQLRDGQGELQGAVKADIEAGPGQPLSYMGKVASLLYTRYCAGEKPVALVSMDNCSHNGDRLKEAVLVLAQGWEEKGLVQKGFVSYLNDETKVSFPWTMIDKITPRPDEAVRDILKADGVEGMDRIVTARGTYASAFVNAEECEYLVIEDKFPAGRPQLERAGFLFADRETVEKTERMKVCTCLNPLHTALAVYGCLLGYERISEEMKDETLVRLIRGIGYLEGLPMVVDPGILNPREFIDTVIDDRLPNPFLPDTPQRIATDTSQKLAVRFGETIRAYERLGQGAAAKLTWIPLALAGWLRYLMAVDDEGREFTLSPDPLLEELRPAASQLRLGEEQDVEAIVGPVCRRSDLFGVDLYDAGLVQKVCGYLSELKAGPGAVRRTLEKYTGVKAEAEK